MPVSTRQMYYLALARAIEIGPRKVSVNKVPTAAYFLTKTELKLLFVENGYSARRKAWMNNIVDWRMFGTWVEDGFDDETKPVKYVYFNTLDARDLQRLHMFAEDNHCVNCYPEIPEGTTA